MEPWGSCGLRADDRVSYSASRLRAGKIVEIDLIADPERLRLVDLVVLDN